MAVDLVENASSFQLENNKQMKFLVGLKTEFRVVMQTPTFYSKSNLPFKAEWKNQRNIIIRLPE